MNDDEQNKERGVAVDHTQLDPQTLRNVIEDLVTRDGTDYGEVELTREEKAKRLLQQLQRGEAKLVFDLTTETLGLMTAAELKRAKVVD